MLRQKTNERFLDFVKRCEEACPAVKTTFKAFDAPYRALKFTGMHVVQSMMKTRKMSRLIFGFVAAFRLQINILERSHMIAFFLIVSMSNRAFIRPLHAFAIQPRPYILCL